MSFKHRYLNEADTVPTAALQNVLEPSYKQAPNQKPTPKISTGPTKVDNSAPLSTSDVAKASGSVNQSVNDLQKFKRT